MEQDFDLRSYFGILRRRVWFLVIPTALVFVVVCAVVLLLPRVYQASAKILVESQRIPTDLASPTVTANAAEQIQIIQQRLMTRDKLLKIADKFDLYQDERRRPSLTETVDRMRQATEIEQLAVGISIGRRAGGVIGFTVSFTYGDPQVAAGVANELVAAILSQNLQTRIGRASETNEFFEQQQVKLEQKLLSLENRIADFKRENESFLPETLPYRRTQQLQLADQIAELDRQIDLAASPELVGLGSNGDRLLDYQLKTKQFKLDSIREDRETLAPLAERGIVPNNRIREIDRALASAELDLEAVKTEIAAKGSPVGSEDRLEHLMAQRAELGEKASAIKDSILRTPQVEAELNALNRDYESLQAEYRQAQAKLAEAGTGKRLEEDRQAERFEVLEAATVPSKPAKPERKKLILAGSFASMAAGAGMVILMELLDKSVRTVADLEKRLQLRPIATIPYVVTSAEKRKRRWRTILLLVLAAAGVALILFLVHTYYLPLDVLLDRLLRRVGF